MSLPAHTRGALVNSCSPVCGIHETMGAAARVQPIRRIGEAEGCALRKVIEHFVICIGGHSYELSVMQRLRDEGWAEELECMDDMEKREFVNIKGVRTSQKLTDHGSCTRLPERL